MELNDRGLVEFELQRFLEDSEHAKACWHVLEGHKMGLAPKARGLQHITEEHAAGVIREYDDRYSNFITLIHLADRLRLAKRVEELFLEPPPVRELSRPQHRQVLVAPPGDDKVFYTLGPRK